MQAALNMEITSINYMAPMLQQCLFSLNHVMCTEAQPQIYHSGCHHGCWHPHSADAQHLCFLYQKGLLEIVLAKLKWLHCLPSVWHQSSEYRPFAIPNSSLYFLHFHSKYQYTDVVFVILDTLHLLLFVFYSWSSAFSFTYMLMCPAYCSLFTLCRCMSCKQRSSRSTLCRKNVSTFCDSAKSEDGPILKHRKWLRKMHSKKSAVLLSCQYCTFCPVCVCCRYNCNYR